MRHSWRQSDIILRDSIGVQGINDPSSLNVDNGVLALHICVVFPVPSRTWTVHLCEIPIAAMCKPTDGRLVHQEALIFDLIELQLLSKETLLSSRTKDRRTTLL